MSELLTPQVPNHTLDDIVEARESSDLAALSAGHLSPEAYELTHIPRQESSFFDAFERSLAEDVQTNKLLAYELRSMPTEEFIGTLYKHGVISDSLQASGLLEARFASDETLYVKDGSIVDSSRAGEDGVVKDTISGIKHILLGDSLGGLHDIDTLHDLDAAGEGTDTKEIGKRSKRANETYAAMVRFGIPVDIDFDGVVDRVDLHQTKKTQFPEQWTTDEVLMAVMAVAEAGQPYRENSDGSFSLLGVVSGVQIDVRINSEGKILTGFATGKKPDTGV